MVRKFIYTAIFIVAFGTYVARVVNAGKLTDPPEAGDGHDYDAIAFNLWQLRGYGYNWSDPMWRQPYLEFPRYRAVLARQSDYYPTTYRPPALPYLLSVVYALTDRNFAAWRIVNCAIVAAAVTIAAAISAQLGGLPAAVIVAVLMLQSRQLTHYSQMFMTEGLATFLVTLLAWAWLKNTSKEWTIGRAAGSGVVLGALVATRNIFVLWMPIVLFVPGAGGSLVAKGAWRAKAVCLLFALLVIGPWWVRNIIVTEAFMPLGTQSAINLPSGFSDRALRSQGRWRSNPGDGVPELLARNVDPLSVAFEVQLAKFRSDLTIKWMREHPADVVRLMYLHVRQETRPRGDPLRDWLLPAAAVAAFFFRKTPGVRVIVLMVCAQIFSIALTWAAAGRFMVPVQPLLMALVGGMIAAIAYRVIPSLQRVFARLRA